MCWQLDNLSSTCTLLASGTTWTALTGQNDVGPRQLPVANWGTSVTFWASRHCALYMDQTSGCPGIKRAQAYGWQSPLHWQKLSLAAPTNN